MVVRLSDIRAKTGKKCIFCVFRLFLSLCQTISQPYRLSYINGLRINQSYQPKDRSVKFSQKNFPELAILRNCAFEKSAILSFFLQKKKNFFLLHSNKISANLYGRMDGLKFWCFPWFPGNFLLCVIKRYTVYVCLIKRVF